MRALLAPGFALTGRLSLAGNLALIVSLFLVAQFLSWRQMWPAATVFAFIAASIFRLVFCVILRSPGCRGTAQNPISQPVSLSGSTPSL